jgi:hypothetical protein
VHPQKLLIEKAHLPLKDGKAMQQRFKLKVKQSIDGLYLPLPPELIRLKELQPQTPVELFINERGNIELQFGKVVKGELCVICSSRPGKYTCVNCGAFACSNCMWELAQLCYRCAKRQRR